MLGVPKEWNYEQVFDTFDLGCGDLLLELRTRMASIAPGARVVVASRDAGAPVDLPAWCRVTGHILHEAHPPFFLIEKRRK